MYLTQTDWGYRNRTKYILPKEWPTKWANCGGKRQSPINIVTSHTLPDRKLTRLTIKQKKINQTIHGNNEVWLIRNFAQTGIFLN